MTPEMFMLLYQFDIHFFLHIQSKVICLLLRYYLDQHPYNEFIKSGKKLANDRKYNQQGNKID